MKWDEMRQYKSTKYEKALDCPASCESMHLWLLFNFVFVNVVLVVVVVVSGAVLSCLIFQFFFLLNHYLATPNRMSAIPESDRWRQKFQFQC